MRWYANMTVGKRVLAGFLCVALVAGLSGIFSTGAIWEVSRQSTLMYTANLAPIRELTGVVSGYRSSLGLLRDIILDQSPQEQQEHQEKLKQAELQVSKGLEAFMRGNHSPEARALQQQITEDLKLYGYFRDKILDLAGSGRRDEAVNMLRNQAGDVIERIDASIAKIAALNDKQATARYSENAATARMALVMNLLCLALGVVAAVGLGWLLAGSITRPLKELNQAVDSIAAGDLTVRVAEGYGADSANELHILSRNIDQMSSTLHTILTRISDDATRLFSSSDKLNNTAEAMVQRAEATSSRIDTVATASQELHQTAAEIARNCATAATNVSLVNDGVARSQEIMDETIRSMQRIGEHVGETAKVMAQLGEKSVQINEITATIDDIADQTNLLALNAAIEAARAGDHGRGFAVVADEVRALAARTTSATKEISGMIQAIQNATSQAISVMNQGVGEVEQGSGRVGRSGEALQEIARTMQTIADEVAQIATASEQQSSTIGEIADNIHQVTASIHENTNSTQAFSGEAATLGTMSEDLRGLVGRFTLVPHGEPTGGRYRTVRTAADPGLFGLTEAGCPA